MVYADSKIPSKETSFVTMEDEGLQTRFSEILFGKWPTLKATFLRIR